MIAQLNLWAAELEEACNMHLRGHLCYPKLTGDVLAMGWANKYDSVFQIE